MRDVVFGLRLGVREEPGPLLDALSVLGTPAREDIVQIGVGRIRNESRGDCAADGWRSNVVVGEDLIPVVRRGRGTRRSQGAGGGVAIQFESAQNARRDTILKPLDPES